MDPMINNISIPVLENEIMEYNMFKLKYKKLKKKCENNLLRCFYKKRLSKYEKKYKSKLFYLKMKYTYSDTYIKYFRGIENTDILENILINKELIENPTERPDLEKTRLLPNDTYHMDSNRIIQDNINNYPQLPTTNIQTINPTCIPQKKLPEAIAVRVPVPSAPYFQKKNFQI